jgi:hypothetical protein
VLQVLRLTALQLLLRQVNKLTLLLALIHGLHQRELLPFLLWQLAAVLAVVVAALVLVV